MRLQVATAVVSTFVLAGCGSTVQGQGTGAGPPLVGGGLTSPAPGTTAPAGTSPELAGPGPTGVSPGATGPALTGGSAPAPGATTRNRGTTPGGAAAIPATGHGYDEDHLYLGFPTNTDVSKAAPAGVGATNFGDQEAQIKAVVADVNKRGGLLGRTIVPVFHDIRTADLETDPQNAAQATCIALTEDHTVVAVVNIVAAIDLPVFFACLAKHQTPLVSAGFIPADDNLFATYAPYLYKTTAASFTSLGPVWIDRLQALGYFGGWNPSTGAAAAGPAKVGLLYPDVQPQQRIFARLKSVLAAKHISVAKEFAYDASSLDRESASMSNAVLQFRNAGVTHVLSSESDVLLFMTAADGQHYRPRYGLTSYHAPAVQLQGTVPSSQLVGSMGIGWLPTTDVDRAHNPGPVSPAEKRCRQVMQDAHQDISSAAPAVTAFALCDGVHLLVDGIAAAANPSAQGLRAGLSQVGADFQSALTWHSALSRRYDLPGAVRDFRYDQGAYHYVSSSNQPL